MTFGRLVFRQHAVERMFQRHIAVDDVRKALATSEVIESYPEDTPYPSRLVLGWSGSRPPHIVAAENTQEQETVVITVYEPDRKEWEQGFKRRKA
ncbi:MAG TPA: DUF4258 domain-containing protein [Acidobacteriota bacterium]